MLAVLRLYRFWHGISICTGSAKITQECLSKLSHVLLMVFVFYSRTAFKLSLFVSHHRGNIWGTYAGDSEKSFFIKIVCTDSFPITGEFLDLGK